MTDSRDGPIDVLRHIIAVLRRSSRSGGSFASDRSDFRRAAVRPSQTVNFPPRIINASDRASAMIRRSTP
jgi:hypothetical protein